MRKSLYSTSGLPSSRPELVIVHDVWFHSFGSGKISTHPEASQYGKRDEQKVVAWMHDESRQSEEEPHPSLRA